MNRRFRTSRSSRWLAGLLCVVAVVTESVGQCQSDLRFTVSTVVPTGYGGISIATGDFNGDGKPDFVCGNHFFADLTGDSLDVGLGTGDGTFHSISNYSMWTPKLGSWLNLRKVVTADVNRDGLSDVLVTYGWENGRVGVFTATTGGTLFRQPDVIADRYCKSLAHGDFNGDGNLDFVVNGYQDKRGVIYFGDGHGTFPTSTNVSLPYFASSFAAADMDRDGRPEILVGLGGNYISADGSVGYPSVVILWNRSGGDWNTRTSIRLNHRFLDSQPEVITVADFNADGWPDILAGVDEDSGVTVVMQQGGVFVARTNEVLGGESVLCAVAADLNGDGFPDLATHAHYLVGNGRGEFITSHALDLDEDARPPAVTVADVNGDGRPDILRTTGWVSCLTNHTRPTLSIERAMSQTRISWPAWDGFFLKTAPDLHLNTGWSVVNDGVTKINGRNVVVQPANSPTKYFRLESN